MQKWEKELKMQRPNMALTQKLDLRPNLVSIWGRKTVEKKGRRRSQIKVWNYDYEYGSLDFCMKL